MTNLLVKTFIKDYQNIKDEKVRKKYGELGSFVGIFSNVLLFIAKFLVGFFINSVAILADSFNNLSDCLSSIITLLGFKLGAKPADKEHPFGHGRMEYISGLIVSFMILLIGFEFLKTSFLKIFNPEEVNFTPIALIILIFTVLVKIWQAMFNAKLGKMINSKSLIATAMDSRNDVIITITTILSLVIYKFLGINLDGIFGVIVALFLIYAGINLAKDTLSPLIGEAIDGEVAEKLKNIALSYDEVIGVHDILIHNYGPNKSVGSIHVELPFDIGLNRAHEIIDALEIKVENELGIALTTHMDPVDLKDEKLKALIGYLKQILNENYKNLEAHDFRIVQGKYHKNFIFDLVIPYEFSHKQEEEVLSYINKKIKQFDNSYNCIISLEKSFINKE